MTFNIHLKGFVTGSSLYLSGSQSDKSLVLHGIKLLWAENPLCWVNVLTNMALVQKVEIKMALVVTQTGIRLVKSAIAAAKVSVWCPCPCGGSKERSAMF